MRFDSIELAKAAAATGGELSILGTGVTRITPAELPWHEPALAIIARFIGDESDLQREATIVTARLMDPNGDFLSWVLQWVMTHEEVERQSTDLIPGEPWLNYFIANMPQMEFPVAGLYQFVIYVDGEEVGRYGVAVAPPQESSA